MKLIGNFTFLGFANRQSKSGNTYTVVNVCDSDGSALNSMCDSSIVSSVQRLEQFKPYVFIYDYVPQFQSLKLVAVNPVKA